MSEPLIFDTSVWIDFLRGKRNPQSDLLTSYIEQEDQVLLTPTILQEVLQGIREDTQYRQIKDIFVNSCHVDPVFLDVDPPAKQAIRVRA
jgi:predicted nucleic acid-binding protein